MTTEADKIISNEHVKATCQPGKMALTCRYLLMGVGGWECAKLTSLAVHLDRRVKAGNMVARGDNCAGWPLKLE